jgi:hypothetical protein
MRLCPLCGDGYQDGIGRCRQCDAFLVASLEADEVRKNPPRLFWSGRDLHEFDFVVAALRDARIPARTNRGFGGLAGLILRIPSTVHVLASDLDRALQTAVESLAGRGVALEQLCYNCSAGCSKCFAICPTCKAQLIVQPAVTESRHEPQAFGQLKYCPLCDTEYSSSHDRCSTCGVTLVPEESRGYPLTEAERKDRLELVWRGGDPAALSRAVALLRDAGIRHHVQSCSDHLVFELAMPRPKYNLRVLHSDAGRARELLGDVKESPFFGAQISPDFPHDGGPVIEAPAGLWNPAAANTELWSGEDAAFARLLEACLAENRIGVRRQGMEPGKQRLLVQSAEADRAREILREIVEATPLE